MFHVFRGSKIAKIKLLIFDLDGTLIDSAADVGLAANMILKKHGKPSVKSNDIKEHMGTGPIKLVQDILKKTTQNQSKETTTQSPQEPFNQQIFDDYLNAYKEVMTQNTRVYPKVMEFLKSWRGLLALVTNKPQDLAFTLMEELGFNKFSWVIQIGGDTFDVKKPDPFPLQRAIDLAGVKKDEAVMVGDGLPDVGAAKSLGIPCVAVSYGYTHVETLIEAGASTSISCLSQLTQEKLDSL